MRANELLWLDPEKRGEARVSTNAHEVSGDYTVRLRKVLKNGVGNGIGHFRPDYGANYTSRVVKNGSVVSTLIVETKRAGDREKTGGVSAEIR
jgi:hypothetical protein